MERITVTVCWVAPDGTLADLRKEGDAFASSAAVVAAAADVAAIDHDSLIFVNATSEEA
jgi:hypothetical protein